MKTIIQITNSPDILNYIYIYIYTLLLFLKLMEIV